MAPQAPIGHNPAPLSPPPSPAPILPALHPTKGAVARHRAAGCGGGFRGRRRRGRGLPEVERLDVPSSGTDGRDAQNPRARSRAVRDRRCIDTSTSTLDIGTRQGRAPPGSAHPLSGNSCETPRLSAGRGLWCAASMIFPGTTPVILGGRRPTGIHHGALSSPRMDPGLRRVPRLGQDDGVEEMGLSAPSATSSRAQRSGDPGPIPEPRSERLWNESRIGAAAPLVRDDTHERDTATPQKSPAVTGRAPVVAHGPTAQAAMALRMFSLTFSRKPVVESHFCSAPTSRARSLVMSPASTVSTVTFSSSVANLARSALPSSLAR